MSYFSEYIFHSSISRFLAFLDSQPRMGRDYRDVVQTRDNRVTSVVTMRGVENGRNVWLCKFIFFFWKKKGRISLRLAKLHKKRIAQISSSMEVVAAWQMRLTSCWGDWYHWPAICKTPRQDLTHAVPCFFFSGKNADWKLVRTILTFDSTSLFLDLNDHRLNIR